jgi:hypothetical protein
MSGPHTVVVQVCVHGVIRTEDCLWCEEPCRECGHSWAQHHKGAAIGNYCRHCPCNSFVSSSRAVPPDAI